MNKFVGGMGRLVFFVTLPVLRLILNRSQRTRVLVVCEGKVLLLKLWLSEGLWMLPGGGLHRKEPSPRAAARELREETGIVAPPGSIKLLGSSRHKARGIEYTFDCYLLELAEPPRIKMQWLEIIAYRWVDITAATELPISSETAFALKKYQAKIKRKNNKRQK